MGPAVQARPLVVADRAAMMRPLPVLSQSPRAVAPSGDLASFPAVRRSPSLERRAADRAIEFRDLRAQIESLPASSPEVARFANVVLQEAAPLSTRLGIAPEDGPRGLHLYPRAAEWLASEDLAGFGDDGRVVHLGPRAARWLVRLTEPGSMRILDSGGDDARDALGALSDFYHEAVHASAPLRGRPWREVIGPPGRRFLEDGLAETTGQQFLPEFTRRLTGQPATAAVREFARRPNAYPHSYSVVRDILAARGTEPGASPAWPVLRRLRAADFGDELEAAVLDAIATPSNHGALREPLRRWFRETATAQPWERARSFRRLLRAHGILLRR